jgi:hypothetical protein
MAMRLEQAVRLAGAQPVLADTIDALQRALREGGVACVLAVESQLASGSGSQQTAQLLALARQHRRAAGAGRGRAGLACG